MSMPIEMAAQMGRTKIEIRMKKTKRFFASRLVISTLFTKRTSSTTMPTKHNELTTRKSILPVECTAKKMMNNKTYDLLKWIAQIALPALGALYFALAQIWGLPYGEQIVGTITAIDCFLGALLGISTMLYNKGK